MKAATQKHIKKLEEQGVLKALEEQGKSIEVTLHEATMIETLIVPQHTITRESGREFSFVESVFFF